MNLVPQCFAHFGGSQFDAVAELAAVHWVRRLAKIWKCQFKSTIASLYGPGLNCPLVLLVPDSLPSLRLRALRLNDLVDDDAISVGRKRPLRRL